ncbi:MAG: ATP-binding cassette domain-containing protein [Candidatus Shapirobacteria bacterium]|jgi:cell division transport system ATP-binding protein
MKVIFDNVSKNFGIISALKDINLNIDNGEFIFIVGPSGAGKSTLLKLILGQIRPSSGLITIDDIDFGHAKKSQIDKIRRKIGIIFQDYQLIADKSVEENISLALDIVDFPPTERQSRIDEVIKKVNLSSRRFLFPSQLSGGEMQRAALARALAIKPSLILADEPTGNLDVENSWNLIKLLKDVNEQYNTSIIMTTHNLDIVDSLNKKIIKLRNGEIEQKK